MSVTVSRRNFLKFSAALVVGFYMPTKAEAAAGLSGFDLLRDETSRFEPNGYVRIDPDGTITLQIHRSELGQGVNTSIAMILCEELDVDLASIQYHQSPPDSMYGDQVTGGSVSISGSYSSLRGAGALARTTLILAAAQTWGVDPASCRTENGTVIHDESGQSLTYGELVPTAVTLERPTRDQMIFKDEATYKLIGTSQRSLDAPAMVTGKAVYCSDVQLPGMLVAVIARCPVVAGGSVASYDATAALQVPGVRQVIEVSNGIAVVADDTWSALKGRDALTITWDEGKLADLSVDDMRETLRAGIELKNDPNILEVIYEIPYLAHTTMEPMTCVADVRADSAEVWAPTQNRQSALRMAGSVSGLDREKITLHVPLVGGAFGRRLEVDYVREAVEISQAVGAPIKLFWTREEDIQHDYYHPFELIYCSADINPPGRMRQTPRPGYNVPTGAWRSVGEHPTAFGQGCFIDELGVARGQQPLDAHRELHAETPRAAVLELAVEKAGWDTPLPEGWGRGVASFSTFGATHVAMVVEVSVDGTNVRVQRVVAAVDCGRAINPDGVKMQVEGGIIFGLSAALYGYIDIQHGRVQQSNFHDYHIMQIDEAPQIEVYLVESDDTPSGIGEMGVPPIGPALMNAIYNATGKRVRQIPVRAADLL